MIRTVLSFLVALLIANSARSATTNEHGAAVMQIGGAITQQLVSLKLGTNTLTAPAGELLMNGQPLAGGGGSQVDLSNRVQVLETLIGSSSNLWNGVITNIVAQSTNLLIGITNHIAYVNYSAAGFLPPAVASFTFGPATGAAPLTVLFTNLSSHATEYWWDFGGGNTSNSSAAILENIYTAGTYSVSLIASNSTSASTQTVVNAVTAAAPSSPTNTIYVSGTIASSFFGGRGIFVLGADGVAYTNTYYGSYYILAADGSIYYQVGPGTNDLLWACSTPTVGDFAWVNYVKIFGSNEGADGTYTWNGTSSRWENGSFYIALNESTYELRDGSDTLLYHAGNMDGASWTADGGTGSVSSLYHPVGDYSGTSSYTAP